jgi:8-oxo-dGTP pyrophosphatase MutT (NUDIX family)
VRIDRPASGEELNEGPETTPRVAASVIVLRGSDGGPEVLLVRRNPAARFMGGAWVFPGGAVSGDESPAAAGLRELREEASIDLGDRVEALVPFSRWITPAEVKLRFDTFFYVVEAPAGAHAVADGEECVDARWIRPADAAIAAAREREIVPVQPRIVVAEGDARVVLPGEPGFDD